LAQAESKLEAKPLRMPEVPQCAVFILELLPRMGAMKALAEFNASQEDWFASCFMRLRLVTLMLVGHASLPWVLLLLVRADAACG
jgi:hypothetical protein